ncbi:Unknown protein [Striga hermonthica]|uniref:CCHC-type domain-containing protein n=1 Tax=Striga hermonthica TaxID=68872 RepID=A0A9N7NNK4_STRHE|nr:Unknown protein [Striga hermonthica]
MNTIDASVRSSIPNIEIAQHLWQHIRDRFSVVNGTRIQQLKGEIATTYQKGMTISAYYGKLRTLWDELYAYDRPVACGCGKCICPLEAEHENRKDNEQCHQFLLNLDAEIFGLARSQILAQEPLPNLHRVYSVMVQEERLGTIGKTTSSTVVDVHSFATIARLKPPAPTRPATPSGASCSVCGRTGHDSSRCLKVVPCPHCSRTGHNPKQCYELLGYPASWQQTSTGASSFSAGRGSVTAGAGRGVPPVAGRGRGMPPVQANATGVLPVGFSAASVPPPGLATSLATTGISLDQWSALLNLVQSQFFAASSTLTGKPYSHLWMPLVVSGGIVLSIALMAPLKDIRLAL